MAIPAFLGATQRVSVTFFSWDSINGVNVEEDPDTVKVRIYDTSPSPDLLLSTEVPVNESTGTYSYDWTSTEIGDFNVQFYGVFTDDSVAISNNYFEVYDEVIPASSPLGTDFELIFASSLTPLYLDPEELAIFFPDAPLVDIAEQIHYASLTAMPYLVNGEVTPLILEYVQAMAACALSRNYDPTGNMGMGGGQEDSVTLGDLMVKSGSGAASRGGAAINRGNAATWCELAMVLRKELMRSKAGMRATQKAQRWPSRHATREFKRTF